MEGASFKLAFLLLIVANASVLIPLTADAKCKEHGPKHAHPPRPSLAPTSSLAPTPAPTGIPPYQIHGCGYQCTDSNDCDWPCTVCCANQTCCYDEPMDLPPLPSSPLPPPAVVQAPAPAPIVADVPAINADVPAPFPTTFPPYQIHGCGYKCSDSNDCDWPCTMCCYQNQTCCYEEPFPE